MLDRGLFAGAWLIARMTARESGDEGGQESHYVQGWWFPALAERIGRNMMDVYKNKASGKYFICVAELGEGRALLITPLGDTKALDLSLFHDHEILDSDDLLESDTVNRQQLERYHGSDTNPAYEP